MFGQYKFNGTTAQNVGYSSYVANLSQSSTNPPTTTFESNGLSGAVTYTRSGPGNYRANSSGLFTSNKTTINIAQNDSSAIFTVLWLNSSTIIIGTTEIVSQTSLDGYLNQTLFEIRVYP